MQSISPLQERWQVVSASIAHAARMQDRDPPMLVAVSKKQPADAIAELAGYGQRDFGENYVQEAAEKMSQLQDERDLITWHLIGHLQSNKAAQAAQLFDWVHTVDRGKLLKPLSQGRTATHDSPLNVLIQVNIDEQDSKSGCAPQDIDALADAIIETPGLQLRGLMTIGKVHEDPDDVLDTFAKMYEQFEYLQSRFAFVDTLSMGMSGDYVQAMSQGSTLIRVGTAIFGQRPVAKDD